MPPIGGSHHDAQEVVSSPHSEPLAAIAAKAARGRNHQIWAREPAMQVRSRAGLTHPWQRRERLFPALKAPARAQRSSAALAASRIERNRLSLREVA